MADRTTIVLKVTFLIDFILYLIYINDGTKVKKGLRAYLYLMNDNYQQIVWYLSDGNKYLNQWKFVMSIPFIKLYGKINEENNGMP